MMASKLCRRKLARIGKLKQISDVRVMFSAKNANSEFCLDCKGGSSPQDRFGVNLVGKLMVELGINRFKIFLPAGTVYALRSKMYSVKRVFPRRGVFPTKYEVEKVRPRLG
jgi:hypothetical protein